MDDWADTRREWAKREVHNKVCFETKKDTTWMI
jgi:hypothetical protein